MIVWSEDKLKEYYPEVKELLKEAYEDNGKIYIKTIQRSPMKLGYCNSAKLMDMLEDDGYVVVVDDSKDFHRKVTEKVIQEGKEVVRK